MTSEQFMAEVAKLKDDIQQLTPEHKERLLLHLAGEYAHFLEEQWCGAMEALEILRNRIEEVS